MYIKYYVYYICKLMYYFQHKLKRPASEIHVSFGLQFFIVIFTI